MAEGARRVFEQLHAQVAAAAEGGTSPRDTAAMQLGVNDETAEEIWRVLGEEWEENVLPAVAMHGASGVFGAMIGVFIAGALWERDRD